MEAISCQQERLIPHFYEVLLTEDWRSYAQKGIFKHGMERLIQFPDKFDAGTFHNGSGYPSPVWPGPYPKNNFLLKIIIAPWGFYFKLSFKNRKISCPSHRLIVWVHYLTKRHNQVKIGSCRGSDHVRSDFN